LAERNTIERVKARQGLLSKVQNLFLFGYATKEDLRELDKKMRDDQYRALCDIHHTWEQIYRSILEAGIKISNQDLKRVLLVLDRVMANIRRADYGYAGLWDRKGQINENELARIFNFDRTVSIDIENMTETVRSISRNIDEENWIKTRTDIKQVKQLLYALEVKWNERENLFRPLEV